VTFAQGELLGAVKHTSRSNAKNMYRSTAVAMAPVMRYSSRLSCMGNNTSRVRKRSPR
jgi:hypothetical protein